MTKNKNILSKIYTTVVLIVSFALCILGADLCSTFITVGSFSFSSSAVKQNEFDVYAISFANCSTLVQANQLTDTYKKQGAGGYVWQNNGAYQVFASGYLSESDAEKVGEKLTSSNVKFEIIKLEFDELIIDGDFSVQEKNVLANSIGAFKTCYQKLYDISVSFDTNVTNEVETKIAIGNTKSEMVKIKSDFDSVFTAKITNSLVVLKLKLAKLIDVLDSLSGKEIYLAGEIKYSYFDCLKLYDDFIDEINIKS